MQGAAIMGPIASMIACVFGAGLGLYALISPAWASKLILLLPFLATLGLGL